MRERFLYAGYDVGAKRCSQARGGLHTLNARLFCRPSRESDCLSSGIDLTAVIVAVCRYFNIEEEELASFAKRPKIASARAVVGHIATRYLRVSGSEVARRLNVDGSTISREVQRVEHDCDLIEDVLCRLEGNTSQG